MPLYSYYCKVCDVDSETLCKIEGRDSQRCEECGYSLIRSIDQPGLVWSPTKNGGLST
jgi:putative FmdB family regulatory protein